ncbi:hypothetical protein F8388_023147 [Cannabis sativa]|uniref:Uncharacterized protein n=1 Tax=Cannabis sativa TaxID=3483 RepID=A0A7J6HDC1_CANSA|nr:hypothetical protein F8388_023147 [Cannabis sativa]
MKSNVNATLNASTDRCSLGMVVRDSRGNTPAPIDTAFSNCITTRSSSVASLRTAYPDFLPLQYKAHIGSCAILVFSEGCLSHSNAIRTIPVPMSWSSFPVGIASSRTRLGRHLGFSWKARANSAEELGGFGGWSEDDLWDGWREMGGLCLWGDDGGGACELKMRYIVLTNMVL